MAGGVGVGGALMDCASARRVRILHHASSRKSSTAMGSVWCLRLGRGRQTRSSDGDHAVKCLGYGGSNPLLELMWCFLGGRRTPQLPRDRVGAGSGQEGASARCASRLKALYYARRGSRRLDDRAVSAPVINR